VLVFLKIVIVPSPQGSHRVGSDSLTISRQCRKSSLKGRGR